MIQIKCPNCGGEVGNTRYCQYCGSQISFDMIREQEKLNIEGCPNCGSSNIRFEREKQGEYQEGYSKSILYKTVGFCKDCGYTWYPDFENEYDDISYRLPDPENEYYIPKKDVTVKKETAVKKNNTALWVLGWIFCFPIPAMALIWSKENTWDTKTKLAFTLLFWAFLAMFAKAKGGS